MCNVLNGLILIFLSTALIIEMRLIISLWRDVKSLREKDSPHLNNQKRKGEDEESNRVK